MDRSRRRKHEHVWNCFERLECHQGWLKRVSSIGGVPHIHGLLLVVVARVCCFFCFRDTVSRVFICCQSCYSDRVH